MGGAAPAGASRRDPDEGGGWEAADEDGAEAKAEELPSAGNASLEEREAAAAFE